MSAVSAVSAAAPRDPRDTLVVVGGRPLDRVDAEAVAHAAGRLDDASADLRAAAAGCSSASARLEHAAWTAAAARHAAGLAADVARRLHARSAACALTAERLLRAAGLYVHAESHAERAVGAVVATGSAAAALGVSAVLRLPAVAPWARLGGHLGVWLGAGADAARGRADAARGGADGAGAGAGAGVPPSCTPVPGGPAVAVTRAIAPYADEAVAGAASGVAAGSPLRARFDLAVTGGARVLASAVHELLPRTTVTVRETAGLAGGRPAWAGAPAGTVAEALARTADLYPWGSGIAGREAVGAPAGTLAVERVEHADGRVSWTVLVPGTQGLVSVRHPFDGVTDLDLVAQEASDVAAAVTAALEQAGARPEEPVVLVGHSLGGIVATALAASPEFRAGHRVGGVVTAGSPTAAFATPPGVPVLHLENEEELVSPLDGRSTAENPATADRVTVGRALRDSVHPADVAASGAVAAAHAMPTHLRTLELARTSGSAQVGDVVGRLERLLGGERGTTRFYTARRTLVGEGPVVLAPGEGPVSPSSGRTLR
ncbi:triacylglycerol lipase [Isoptericola variabilis]|uniref:esterase/lipase family protein n=1 Tax=Isoptericola variabilis TaxID=139208 RepID=UPI0011AADBB6|nr:thioesterase domain-containing protein [Isoptericola variabilis]